MKQIVITLDSTDIISLEKQGDNEALKKVHDVASFYAFIFLSRYFSIFDTMVA
jgi:hypothetical protein